MVLLLILGEVPNAILYLVIDVLVSHQVIVCMGLYRGCSLLLSLLHPIVLVLWRETCLGEAASANQGEGHHKFAALEGAEVNLPVEGICEYLRDFHVNVNLGLQDALEFGQLGQFHDPHVVLLVQLKL